VIIKERERERERERESDRDKRKTKTRNIPGAMECGTAPRSQALRD